MLVREVMTTEVVTVRVDTQVKQALRLLDAHNITSTPVIDSRRRVVAVVSEADLLRASVLHDPRARISPVAEDPGDVARYVEEVMTRHPMVIEPDADVAEAVDLMTSTAVKSLPVVHEQQRLVGMISRHDVVHQLARADGLIKESVDELLDELGLGWLATVDAGVVTVEGPRSWREHELARTAAATVAGVRSVEIAG
jgi:CBS domain-containing protein